MHKISFSISFTYSKAQISFSMKLFIILVVFIALSNGQDVAGYPDTLLADINPGPDSSSPDIWYTIESAGKAYTTVNITGKLFKQIVVTDGTTSGTKLITEINISQRGDPYAKNPFFDPRSDYPIQFYEFNGILWLSLYNYNASYWDVYTIDPADDILKKYTGGIVRTINGDYGDYYLNIRKARIFKSQPFAFSPDVINHGLYFFDKMFTTAYAVNNASQFMINPDPYNPFTGFDDSSSAYYVTDDLLIIEGWVQNNGGLWAFDGTNVWPLNLGSQKFHDSVKYFDSVNNKLFYIAFFNDLPQLVVNDLNDLTSNYTILTNLQQDCFPLYDCFSYLSAMDQQQGTVAFAYNDQLGFSDGTLAGTTFLVGNPRVYSVLGAYNGKLYFEQYKDISTAGGYLTVTDGTVEGTKVVIDLYVTSRFFYFNDVVLFSMGTGFWKLDQNESLTLLRDDLRSFNGEFSRITLPNNHKQLYLYFKYSRNCGRGCNRKYYYIYVTDGNGIVQFSGNFETAEQNVFLNNRFLMDGYESNTGHELFYMNPAAESYETPPPIPVSEPTTSATSDVASIAFSFFMFITIASLCQ